MKKTLLITGAVIMLAALFIIASAQSSKREGKNGGAETQWEYLVVAGGNVNLSTSGNEQFGSMRKQPDGSFSREAFALERNMDKLGARGWELVAVTGAPNDPVFYFKRPKESR
jgi:hypothetical protein